MTNTSTQQGRYYEIEGTDVATAGLTFYSAGLVEYMKTLDIKSVGTTVKLSIVGMAIDLGKYGAALQSGNFYNVGKELTSITCGTIFGIGGGIIGAALGGAPAVVGVTAGNTIGSKTGEWLWAEVIAPAMGVGPDGNPVGATLVVPKITSVSSSSVVDGNGKTVGYAIDTKLDDGNVITAFTDTNGVYLGKAVGPSQRSVVIVNGVTTYSTQFYDASSNPLDYATLNGSFKEHRVTNGQSSIDNAWIDPSTQKLTATLTPAGNIEADFQQNASSPVMHVATSANADGTITTVLSNGTKYVTTYLNNGNIVDAITYSDGHQATRTTTPGGGVSEVPVDPTPTIDANSLLAWLNFIQAVHNGTPLQKVTSGVNLATVLSPPNTALSGVGAGFGEAGSLLALERSLQNHDLFGSVNASVQAINYGAQIYAAYLSTNSSQSAAAALQAELKNGANGAFGESAGFFQGIAEAAPWIAAAYSLSQGDVKGVIIAVLASNPATLPLAVIATVLDMIFGSDGDTPRPFGVSEFITNDDGSLGVSTSGIDGGDAQSRNTLEQFKTSIENLVAQYGKINPANPLFLVSNRMPGLVFNKDHFYLQDVINPKTGINIVPHYDSQGHRTDAVLGSDGYFRDMAKQFVFSCLEQSAIVLRWEMETARIQNRMYIEERMGQAPDEAALASVGWEPVIPDNLLYPGVTELQGAAKLNALAPANAPISFKPIALDTNGDGAIGILAMNDTTNHAVFDVDGSGFLRHTAWIGKGDGFLVLDRNYNGRADIGNDLFSNALVADELKGMPSLHWVDANRDGVIDERDPVFDQLHIWQDNNANGVVDDGDTVKNLADLHGHGIAFRYAQGTFEMDGASHPMASPNLKADDIGVVTTPVKDANNNILKDAQGNPFGLYVAYSDGTRELIVNALQDGNGYKFVVGGREDLPVAIRTSDLAATGQITVTATRGGSVSTLGGLTVFTPAADYSGNASFTYTAGSSVQKQVDIYLAPANDAPVITEVTHTSGTIYGYAKIKNDGGTLKLSKPVFTQGRAGYDQKGVYHPWLLQPLLDGNGAPLIAVDPYCGKIAASDADVGDRVFFTVTGQGHHGTAEIAEDGSWTFTPQHQRGQLRISF